MSREVRGNSSHRPEETENPNKNDGNEAVRGNSSHDLPEWLQEFRHSLVDESFPEHRNASTSSHELLSEPRAKSAWEPKLQGPLAEDALVRSCPELIFLGDLVTADHKVLSEGCESRHNHRCAVVVQDLATQWIQSYPCKTKTSQETEKSLQKFLEPTRKPTVIHTDNSLEFWKSSEDLSWNHCTSTPHRSETNGIAESAQNWGRDIRGTVAIRSGRKMVGGFHGMLLLSAKHSRSLVWWEDTLWKVVRSTIFMAQLLRSERW